MSYENGYELQPAGTRARSTRSHDVLFCVSGARFPVLPLLDAVL